ncbi:MAG: hypothetical protein ACRCR9_02955 [Chitinophagaceae bacterium]
MKLNRNVVVICIALILFLLLIYWRQCGRVPASIPQKSIDTTTSRTSNYKTDTIIKTLNVYKGEKDTLVISQRDAIYQEKNLIDTLHNLSVLKNTDYQDKLRQEEEYIRENKILKNIQKQKDDSIKMLLFRMHALQKEINVVGFEKKQQHDITKKKEYFLIKNILFTGLFKSTKTGKQQKTIYWGLLKEVLLSMDFIVNTSVKEDSKNQTVYIKISDLQTEQLIYITEKKPKNSYGLENGEKINYSLQSQIVFDKQNIAKLEIIYPMKWVLKKNATIKVEVCYNKEKIGEHISEIKSGTPVTTS